MQYFNLDCWRTKFKEFELSFTILHCRNNKQWYHCGEWQNKLWQDILITNCRKIVGKSKQQQRKTTPFIQMQIRLLIKRKKEHRQIYSQAYISVVWYFGKNSTSLQRNGMVAIPKILTFNHGSLESSDSSDSMVSTAICYLGGPEFKCRQGKELSILNKKECCGFLWVTIVIVY